MEQWQPPTDAPYTPQPVRKVPPSGWYDDPEGPGSRYWDGAQWTDNRSPDRKHGAPVGGIIVALLVPIVGVIVALVLLAKGRGAHGAAVLLASALGAILGVVVLGMLAAP